METAYNYEQDLLSEIDEGMRKLESKLHSMEAKGLENTEEYKETADLYYSKVQESFDFSNEMNARFH